jgi:hypothetical protein
MSSADFSNTAPLFEISHGKNKRFPAAATRFTPQVFRMTIGHLDLKHDYPPGEPYI